MDTNTPAVPPAPRGADGMAQIGPTRHQLLGVRFFNDEGGAGAPPADPPATPPAPPAPPATPPATPQPPAPQPPAPVQYKGNPDDYVRELREESKTHRIAAEKAAADYQAAQAERETATAQLAETQRTLAVVRTASKAGANADALLDSNSFMKTIADIDPTDLAAVEKAITDAVEKNSALRAAALPAMSGGGHQGGGTPKPKPTLTSAVSGALGG